ncbi:hypothetical protein AGMMS49928_20530 [Spirochaetia bacterium]|nr:hypothetical protein AGMMS49928_20530 [Spirochaetia bacterium]
MKMVLTKNYLVIAAAAALAFFPAIAGAQEGFGFGSDSGETSSPAPGAAESPLKITGKVSAGLTAFFDDMYSFSKAGDIKPGDIFSGNLKFSYTGSSADAVINLKLSTGNYPVGLDEAYLRAYFGPVFLEAGLRKLTWGKADTMGPLDVINPLDFSDLTTISDADDLKIARPMIHASWSIGSFSKLEAVFVPWFEGRRLDLAGNGKWKPREIEAAINKINEQFAVLGPAFTSLDLPSLPDTTALKYFQAGGRFTTTIGSSDIGFQYYFGRLQNPALVISTTPMPPYLIPTAVELTYNPYHQIGVDYAQVLFDFNLRAEAAVNITGDLAGDDGAVYNPHIVWSLGFDRDLFWGINLNLQCNETIRLMQNKVGDASSFDIESSSDLTGTQIIGALSKKFFRDELEIRAAAFWEIEAKDFLIMPSLTWTKNDVKAELSSGIFGGDEDAQFGQFHDNNFVRLKLSYSF